MIWATEKTQPGAFCMCMFMLKFTLAIAFADLSNNCKLCCMMQKLAGILTFDSVHACPYPKTPQTVRQGHSQLCVSCMTFGPKSCAHADPNCWADALAATAVLAATAGCVSSSAKLFSGSGAKPVGCHCCTAVLACRATIAWPHHGLFEPSKLQILCSKTHFQHTMLVICCSFHT